jgi:hypothetical protein
MESYLVQCKHSLNFNQVKCNKKLFKLTSSPYPNPHTRLCIYTCTWLCSSVGRALLQNRKVTGLIHARGPKCCIFHNHSPLMSKMVYIICPLEMSTFWYTLQCLLRLVSKLYHPRRTELHFFTFIDLHFTFLLTFCRDGIKHEGKDAIAIHYYEKNSEFLQPIIGQVREYLKSTNNGQANVSRNFLDKNFCCGNSQDAIQVLPL